jgi:hypothetical protein
MSSASPWLVAATLVLLAGGCADASDTKPPPPAPQAEAVPPPPAPGLVWQMGYYRWNGAAYLWEPGRYVEPYARTWAPGHLTIRDGGVVWVPGHWV